MILEMDFGNSRIKWRLRKLSDIVSRGVVDREQGLADVAQAMLQYVAQIKSVYVASVLDETAKGWINFWAKKNLNITPRYATSQAEIAGVINGYNEPLRLGVDRWLAIVSAYKKCHSACVVISCGTAFTVDLVDTQGRHLGGYIVPGRTTALMSLNNNTQLISLSEIKSAALAPGKFTQSAVDHGLAACYVGLVQNSITQLAAQTNIACPVILATGGDAKFLKDLFPEIQIDEELILDGLAYCLV